jgi:hypothetical protein
MLPTFGYCCPWPALGLEDAEPIHHLDGRSFRSKLVLSKSLSQTLSSSKGASPVLSLSKGRRGGGSGNRSAQILSVDPVYSVILLAAP